MYACLTIWPFLWDDEMARPSGHLAGEFKGNAEVFLGHSLGLVDILPEKVCHLVISSFSVIWNILRILYTKG